MTLQIKLPIQAVEFNRGGHAEALLSLLQATGVHTLEHITCDTTDSFKQLEHLPNLQNVPNTSWLCHRNCFPIQEFLNK